MPSKPTKILGIVPARGGSKGVPRKNVRPLGGKPLIAYTIEAAKACSLIDRLICSTDDAEIAEVARKFGCDVPFMRPPELATDQAKAVHVIQHAIRAMEEIDQCIYDPIVYLEPPSPFRETQDIEKCLKMYLKENPDSAVSVYEANHYHPAYMKKIVNHRLEPYCMDEPEGMPRQMYEPKAYLRNGSVYVFKRDLILKGQLYGKDILAYEMPWDRSICIDDMIDWFAAEGMLSFKREAQP